MAYSLLCARDDPVFPIWCLLCGRLQSGNVTSGKGFSDGQADELSARKDVRYDTLDELGRAKVDHRRDANGVSGKHTYMQGRFSASWSNIKDIRLAIKVTSLSSTPQFLRNDDFCDGDEW